RRHPVRHHGVPAGRPDRARPARARAAAPARSVAADRDGCRDVSRLLAVDGLSKRFGGLQAVADISFQVASGEILGATGPNGAAKTTAVNLISGVLKPPGGRVRLADRDVTGLAPHRLVASGLVRTFQATTVYAGQTVRENLLRGAFRRLYPGLLASLF